MKTVEQRERHKAIDPLARDERMVQAVAGFFAKHSRDIEEDNVLNKLATTIVNISSEEAEEISPHRRDGALSQVEYEMIRLSSLMHTGLRKGFTNFETPEYKDTYFAFYQGLKGAIGAVHRREANATKPSSAAA